jgi:putative salt-induced outer membrane protein YdiY
MRILFVLPLLISSSFALVSIEPVDIGDTPGLSGTLSGSFNAKSGNTEKEEYAAGVRMQYDEGSRYVTWTSATYEYGESADVKNEDRLYAHWRYIHALTDTTFCGELFAQVEEDDFKNINNRSLGGAGVRWRFFNSKAWGKGYAGLGLFGERIRYLDSSVNPDEAHERYNSYIAYTKAFMERSKFSYVAYYQPRVDRTEDAVTVHSAQLQIPVFGKLDLMVTLDWSYDSRPPIGVEKVDRAYATSLMWAF